MSAPELCAQISALLPQLSVTALQAVLQTVQAEASTKRQAEGLPQAASDGAGVLPAAVAGAPSARSVAFIGMGAMGRPMSKHMCAAVLRAGGKAQVWNRTGSRAEEAAAESGAQVAQTLEDLQGCEVIFTCLPTSQEVEAVAQQLSDVLSLGATVVDCTSGDPVVTRRVGEHLRAKGIAMVDCPVSGGPRGAQAGSVTSMLGGDEVDVAKVLPLVQTFSGKVSHVGPLGSAHAVKVINNIMNSTHLVAAAEGLLVLAKRFGVDPAVACDVINQSSGRSLQSQVRIPEEVLTGRYSYGFKLGLMAKDCRIAVSIVRDQEDELAANTQLLPGTLSRLEEAQKKYGADADYTCVVKLLEEACGLDLRPLT
mmetsp:Transcript_85545/g.228842  ORF Transcript_85545/g.228842 Transcript_85545/m.228842 type:complete len:367 (+) Transcript_85545:11-1111(+)